MVDLLSQSTRILVDLFQGPLRDVRFPDADAARLDTVVDAVTTANAAVARAEAELVAARESLAEKQRFLALETERTLAYVRVYAADRPDVRAALDATAKPKSGARRGRPRKVALEGEPVEAAAE